jgi:acyl carrier protein
MNEHHVKNQIKKYIINNFLFGSEDTVIEDHDSFLKKGIIDSTGILELIGYIEENYQIKIEDHELLPENLDSLQNVTNFILAKQKQAS